jgi:hypothetical protein
MQKILLQIHKYCTAHPAIHAARALLIFRPAARLSVRPPQLDAVLVGEGTQERDQHPRGVEADAEEAEHVLWGDDDYAKKQQGRRK